MSIKAGEYKLVVYANGYQRTFDANGNLIHFTNSYGYEYWREYDANGKMIHYKNSGGYEYWREYDANGKMIHYKNSGGYEEWYNSDGEHITKEQFDAIQSPCAGKIVEIDGKKFKLVAV